MEKGTKSLLILIGFLLSGNIFSQQKAIDSLEILLTQKDISIQEKIPYMVSLGIYYNTIDEQKAMLYAKKAVTFARKESDNKYGIYAYAGLAANYADRDSITKCCIAMDSCMWYIRKSTDAKAIAHGLNSLTIIKTMLGDKDDIPDMLQEGLKLIKGKDEWILETKLYYSLFEYYLSTNLNYSKRYLNLASNAANKAKQPLLFIECKTGESIYYLTAFRKDQTNNKLIDSALVASTSALILYNQKAEHISNYYYMNMLQNRAEIYIAKNQPDSAQYYATKLINEAMNLDVDYLSSGYNILCDIELTKDNLPAAKKYLLKSFELLDENNSLADKYELNIKMSGIYKRENNFEKALLYTEEALSILSKDKDEKYIKEGLVTEAKYNIKEKEVELEKANKKNQFYLFCIILSIILIIASILLFWNNKLKLKNSRQEALLLDKEKKEAEVQVTLQSERAKNLNIEKENMELLLESEKNKVLLNVSEINYLRKELLVGNTQLQHKNEMLNSIKQKISEENIDEEVEQLLVDEKRVDELFDGFSNLLKKVHPDFYTKLQEKAQQKLTALDLKYSTYIYMNLSSKDIASILFVEPKTVRMTKYRLKQKLGLSKEEDLNLFIQQIINS